MPTAIFELTFIPFNREIFWFLFHQIVSSAVSISHHTRARTCTHMYTHGRSYRSILCEKKKLCRVVKLTSGKSILNNKRVFVWMNVRKTMVTFPWLKFKPGENVRRQIGCCTLRIKKWPVSFFFRVVLRCLFVPDAINRARSNYQFVSIRRAATSTVQSTENIYLADFHWNFRSSTKSFLKRILSKGIREDSTRSFIIYQRELINNYTL